MCLILIKGEVGVTDAPHTLAIDEEFSLGIVGVAENRCVLSLASGPCPMWEQMKRLLLRSPVSAIQPYAILWQSGEVVDSEVTAA